MGRKKPGKPRRQRSVTYTLQQLQPPGYEEWLDIPQQFTADEAASDPRLGAESVDLMQRFARLRPLYRGLIPIHAVVLDTLLDTGALPISMDGKSAATEGIGRPPLPALENLLITSWWLTRTSATASMGGAR
jgi:hypothetical protein